MAGLVCVWDEMSPMLLEETICGLLAACHNVASWQGSEKSYHKTEGSFGSEIEDLL